MPTHIKNLRQQIAITLLTASVIIAIARWFHPATFESNILSATLLLGFILLLITFLHHGHQHD